MISPNNIKSFLNRFAEKSDPLIPRDLNFEEDLKNHLERNLFLYRSSTAIQSIAKQDWFAAKSHLPWLVVEEPSNPRWTKMLEVVQVNLASEKTMKIPKFAWQLVKENQIKNGTFEESIEGHWTISSFTGFQNAVSQTSDQAKSEHRSLMIKSDVAHDVRCFQPLAVKPNTKYRLRGRVKTLDVVIKEKQGAHGATL